MNWAHIWVVHWFVVIYSSSFWLIQFTLNEMHKILKFQCWSQSSGREAPVSTPQWHGVEATCAAKFCQAYGRPLPWRPLLRPQSLHCKMGIINLWGFCIKWFLLLIDSFLFSSGFAMWPLGLVGWLVTTKWRWSTTGCKNFSLNSRALPKVRTFFVDNSKKMHSFFLLSQ